YGHLKLSGVVEDLIDQMAALAVADRPRRAARRWAVWAEIRKLGITEVRFKKAKLDHPVDLSSDSLVRDPNKCVLCGDCVRYCREIQSIGAIDFAHRGKHTVVTPAFNKDLAKVECVNCGQCAAVCPVGAITVKQDVDKVFAALDNPEKVVVA
ncbi:MAG TPA: 4Fe-4S dicluster domain-containing protein, partial [Candidatus Rifleibacterium sp.]|nr:4Fe-4S dicluster domain-containing protein [Candidatus Rifleibacterium sp.]